MPAAPSSFLPPWRSGLSAPARMEAAARVEGRSSPSVPTDRVERERLAEMAESLPTANVEPTGPRALEQARELLIKLRRHSTTAPSEHGRVLTFGGQVSHVPGLRPLEALRAYYTSLGLAASL